MTERDVLRMLTLEQDPRNHALLTLAYGAGKPSESQGGVICINPNAPPAIAAEWLQRQRGPDAGLLR